MDILKIEKLSDERWLNLYGATFRNKGHTGRWVFASRNNQPKEKAGVVDAVVMAPLLHVEGQEPRLVMLREFRVPVGGYVYGLPAGLLEPGEPIETTARRELREETGYEVTRIKRISPPLYSSCGVTDEAAVLVFLDAHAVPDGRTHHEAGEEIEVVLLSHAEVCRLCNDPAVLIDAKTWGVLYLYQQLGRFA